MYSIYGIVSESESRTSGLLTHPSSCTATWALAIPGPWIFYHSIESEHPFTRTLSANSTEHNYIGRAPRAHGRGHKNKVAPEYSRDGVGKLPAWFVLDPVVHDSNKTMANNNSRAGPWSGARLKLAHQAADSTTRLMMSVLSFHVSFVPNLAFPNIFPSTPPEIHSLEAIESSS